MEAKKSMSIPNRLVLLSFMMIVLLPFVNASFTDAWGEYQDDSGNRGFVHDETGVWNESVSSLTIGAVYDHQPLILDIDRDGSREIILTNGNFLSIYSSSGIVESSIDVGGVNLVQPIAITSDNIIYIVTISNNSGQGNLSSHFFNGTDYLINSSSIIPFYNSTSPIKRYQGVKCRSDTPNACYTVNNRQNPCEINVFKPEGVSCDEQEINVSTSNNAIDYHEPAMKDIDLDGNEEFIYVCDPNDDGTDGLCVYDTGAGNLDTAFSGNGILDGIDDLIEGILAYDTDSDGDAEICLTYYAGAIDTNTVINCYHHTGVSSFTNTFNNDQNSRVTPPFISFIDDDELVCYVNSRTAGTGTSAHRNIRCFLGTNGSLTKSFSGWADGNTNIDNVILGTADFNNDGHDDIITPLRIIDVFNQSVMIELLPTNSTTYDRYSIADVDDDGNLDIITSGTSDVKILSSTVSNNPPVIDNTFRWGGYGSNLGFTSPICVNTTVTFSATECGASNCNYNNDFSEDEERIVSNCGQLLTGNPASSFTDNLENGTFHLANPSFGCNYNKTGTFSVRLFLQDGSNTDDFSQFNTETITVNIINGEPGVTCNRGSSVTVGSESVPETITGQSDFGESAGTVFNVFTGGDSRLKLFVGLIIIVALMLFLWQRTKNLTITLTGTIIGIAVETFFTIVPLWFFIVMMMSIIAMAIIIIRTGVLKND